MTESRPRRLSLKTVKVVTVSDAEVLTQQEHANRAEPTQTEPSDGVCWTYPGKTC